MEPKRKKKMIIQGALEYVTDSYDGGYHLLNEYTLRDTCLEDVLDEFRGKVIEITIKEIKEIDFIVSVSMSPSIEAD